LITLTANINTAFDTVKGLTWIVKLSLDDATRYWASENITISSQEYVGRFILEDGLAEIDQSVDITLGGGMGSVGNTSLSLKEIITQNGLHRDFKPQSAGTELMNRTVDIGCVYNFGTLATTDIVWLYKGTISSFNYSIGSIDLDVYAIREIENIELPYEIINTTDYPNAPKDNIGLPLPILYGDWSETAIATIGGQSISEEWLYEKIKAFPTICTDGLGNIFFASGHALHTMQFAYHRTADMKNYALIKTISAVNTYTEATLDATIGKVTLASGTIMGFCLQQFSTSGYQNSATDYKNAIDGDPATYSILADGATEILSLTTNQLPNGKIVIDSTNAALPLALIVHMESATKFDIDMVKNSTGVVAQTHNFNPAAAVLDGCLLYDGNFDVSEIANYQFEVTTKSATQSCHVKSFAIWFQYIISQQKWVETTSQIRRDTGKSTRDR
jgi:hypothetical protein